MWKSWKYINLSYFLLFVNFIGMIFFFIGVAPEYFQSFYLPHSHYLHPSLPCTAWVFCYLTSQWNEKFFPIPLVYRLLHYFSLSVRLVTDKNPNGCLALLKGWLSFMGTCPPSQAPICTSLPSGHENDPFGFQYVTVLPSKDAECKENSME